MIVANKYLDVLRRAPREAIPLVMSLRMKLKLLAICSLMGMSETCHAQNSANIPSAVVRVDSLAVYPDMNTSGRIVLSLKKGEEVVIDFEIKATEHWCGVRRPPADERGLGLRAMSGLDRIERHSDSPTHASGAPMSPEVSKEAGPAHLASAAKRRCYERLQSNCGTRSAGRFH